MEEEMFALEQNEIWDLTPLPTGIHSIECKWVLEVNMNPNGSTAHLQAQMIAKGFAQTCVDYLETFSPVVKLASIHVLISLPNSNNWPLHQLEVKNAFLHGDLQEEIYVKQPTRFIAQGEYGEVCKLHKSL